MPDALDKLSGQDFPLTRNESLIAPRKQLYLLGEGLLSLTCFLDTEVSIHKFFERLLNLWSLLTLIFLKIVSDFSLIFLLLRIVDRKFSHEEVTWVLVLRFASITDIKVGAGVHGKPLVDNVTIREKNEPIAV